MDSDAQSFLIKLEKVYRKHPEYKREAFHFILTALDFTVKRLKKPRHVTGQELCCGIRDYALDQFGILAKTVFHHWGITETFDFGKIVFHLIDGELMGKTAEDSVEDFRDVYSFEEAFDNAEINYDI